MELRIVLYFWLMLAWWKFVPPAAHISGEFILLPLFGIWEIGIWEWHEARFAKPPEEGGAK